MTQGWARSYRDRGCRLPYVAPSHPDPLRVALSDALVRRGNVAVQVWMGRCRQRLPERPPAAQPVPDEDEDAHAEPAGVDHRRALDVLEEQLGEHRSNRKGAYHRQHGDAGPAEWDVERHLEGPPQLG